MLQELGKIAAIVAQSGRTVFERTVNYPLNRNDSHTRHELVIVIAHHEQITRFRG